MLRRRLDTGSGDMRGRLAALMPSADDLKVFAGSAIVLAALLLIAMENPLFALLAIATASLLLAIVSLGFERTATIILTLAMGFAPLNDVRPSSAASFLTAADLLFVVGLFLLVPVVAFRRIEPPRFFVVGSIIIVSTGFLASIGSSDPGASLNHMSRFVLAALGLPLAFMLWRPSQRVVLWLASAYVAGQMVSIVYGLVQGASETGGRYIGLATHTNFFGLSALLAATLTPYIASSVTRQSLRWVAWGAGLVCVYGIWISGSRAALLAIILVALMYPALERSVKAASVLYVVGTIALLFSSRLLSNSGSNALSRLQGGDNSESSDVARKEALKVAIRAFRDHPILGNGFVDALEAHSIYLQIGVAVGLLGGVGYLFILWSTISPLINIPKPYSLLGYPALAYATIGLITNTLWDRFIWAALTLSLIAHLLAKDDPPDDESTPDPHHRESIEDKV